MKQTVLIPTSCLDSLDWWSQIDNLTKGVSLADFHPQMTLATDASQWGWGAHLLDQRASGPWSQADLKFSINWRELKAIQLALYSSKPLSRAKPS